MFRKIAFLLILSLCFSISTDVYARSKKETTNQVVYMFGYATSFNDSVHYITAIQEVNGAEIGKKGFLSNREFYSNLLKYHIERKYDVKHETAVTFFSTKRSKVEKKYLKLRRRLLNGRANIFEIPAEKFHYISYEEAERKAQQASENEAK